MVFIRISMVLFVFSNFVYMIVSCRFGLAIFVRRRYAKHWHLVVGMVMALFALFALSRTIALHRNFAAPIETYKALNEHLVNENAEQRFRANQQSDVSEH